MTNGVCNLSKVCSNKPCLSRYEAVIAVALGMPVGVCLRDADGLTESSVIFRPSWGAFVTTPQELVESLCEKWGVRLIVTVEPMCEPTELDAHGLEWVQAGVEEVAERLSIPLLRLSPEYICETHGLQCDPVAVRQFVERVSGADDLVPASALAELAAADAQRYRPAVGTTKCHSA